MYWFFTFSFSDLCFVAEEEIKTFAQSYKMTQNNSNNTNTNVW